MSYHVTGTTITMTRGDTFKAKIDLTDVNGDPYVPSEGDIITFGVKSSYSDAACLIFKTIPISTMELVINPEDTKELSFKTYVYDIQLVKASGETDTFITKAKLVITEEVH